MTTAQKVIKYFAIAFAVFLIVTIVSGILTGIYALSGVLGLKNKDNKPVQTDMSLVEIEDNNVAELEIDIISSNITIKTADVLKMETNSQDITYNQNGKKLYIKEKNHNWFRRNNDEIIIYIPEDLEFEKVKIEAGAGNINIEKLSAKKLNFELGAGETTIGNLNIRNECNIEGGAGELTIKSGELNRLDLDMGIGEMNISSKLIGKADIDSGVGSLKININGLEEDYKVKVDKGLGSMKINGKEMSDNQIYGNGDNEIYIDCGIGETIVNFIEK